MLRVLERNPSGRTTFKNGVSYPWGRRKKPQWEDDRCKKCRNKSGKGFDLAKTSTFLSVMKIMYGEAISLDLAIEDAFQLFKTLLLKHACQRHHD